MGLIALLLASTVALSIPDYKVLWEEPFDRLSLRSGGPTEAGYDAGSGRWTPRYPFYEGQPKGGAFPGEFGWMVDPAFDWGGGYPATGQLSVADGVLRIRAERAPPALAEKLPLRPQDRKPFEWVTGVLTTKNSMTFRPPVYIEARVKVPKGQALWPAFWAYGVTNAKHQEIDVLEVVDPNARKSNVGLHWITPQIEVTSFKDRGMDLSLDFHRYGCLWEGSTFRFFIDGVEIWRTDEPADFGKDSMYLILNLSVGGGWPGPPVDATPSPADMLVDYVKVMGADETVLKIRE